MCLFFLGNSTNLNDVEKSLIIKIQVGTPVKNDFEGFARDGVISQQISCPLVIMLTCKEPKLIQNLQITYIYSTPFIVSEPVRYLEDIKNTEVIETNILLSSEYNLSDTKIKVLFNLVGNAGKIVTFDRIVLIPLSLYCVTTDMILENQYKLFIHVSEPSLSLENIFTGKFTLYIYSLIFKHHNNRNIDKITFTDFTKSELIKQEDMIDEITLKYKTSQHIVTVRAAAQGYSIEANDFPEISGILDYFLIRLNEHYSIVNVGAQISFKPSSEFIMHMIHKFLKCVELHAKEKLKLRSLEVSIA